jgi:signal peptidase I
LSGGPHEDGRARVTEERPAIEPGGEPGQEPPRSRAAFWKELGILIGIAVLVAFLVRTFLVETFYIPSISMENTLLVNDRVLVNKVVYHFREPKRGEVIVFEAPESWRAVLTDKEFIKRVIGVGGDHVVCCDDQGRIMINGVPLDEPYVFRDAFGVPDAPSRDRFDIVVPEGRLWVMGDHRSQSGDSRQNFVNTGNVEQATIPVDSVVGRAFVLFWPLNRATWLSVPSTYEAIPPPS